MRIRICLPREGGEMLLGATRLSAVCVLRSFPSDSSRRNAMKAAAGSLRSEAGRAKPNGEGRYRCKFLIISGWLLFGPVCSASGLLFCALLVDVSS